MTDIYISCARADAERMAPIVDELKSEGWSVWFEPEATPARREHAIDAELGAAGAVIVLWSAHSRESEFVRTEAATGLYRNKLIQITMEAEVPPRPFDQLEALHLGGWDGSSGDPTWQRILGCIRLFAGAPGADRPQVVRNSAAGFASEAASRPARRMPGAPESVEPARREPVKATPPAPAATKPVFDAPVEDLAAEASASRADQVLGLVEPEPAAATIEPAVSDSPIQAAVSEMERKISGAARAAEPAVETIPEPKTDAAASDPVANEPIRFSEARGLDFQPADRDDRDWLSGERTTSADDDVIVRPSGRDPRPRRGETRRSNGVAPVAIVGAFAVLGGAVWFIDPMGWRDGGEKAAFAASPGSEAIATGGPLLPTPEGAPVDDPEAREFWGDVDRSDPEALRSFIFAYANSTSAETARALLKVLDAQAWADAVTADVEAGYEAYLASFPAPNGEMAGAAGNRLVSLGEERTQAITAIQIQLRELDFYNGPTTGRADRLSQDAAAAFASREGIAAPVLAEAAPRDLRRFGDAALEAVQSGAARNSQPTQVAALAVTAVAEPEPEPAAPSVARPTPAPAAEPEAAAPEPVVTAPAEAEAEGVEADAESLASEALQLAAWEQASQTGTVEAYGAFLAAYPASPNTVAARAAIEQLSRPPAYGLDWLSADTRSAVEQARAVKETATQRAASARAIASEADAVAASARSGLADARTVIAPDGDIYETQVADSQPNGLGVRTAGDAQSSGDRYRGELRAGLGQGLGVYEYGDNPNNQAAQALRYEGEHAGDVARGYGVTQWRNGNRFEGQNSGEEERGVMSFANGQRYEGEMLNGNRHGYGVFWTADGDVMLAGRWENGDLVEPMTPRSGPDIDAIVAAAAVELAAAEPASAGTAEN